jgi:anaerobic magnesium-protoporphyrin IX monomethyl ester cyclase
MPAPTSPTAGLPLAASPAAPCEVVLLQPPIRDYYLTAKRTIPYGLARIAAVLQRAGISVALLDALATRRKRPHAQPAALSYLEPYLGRQDRGPFSLYSGYRHFGRSHGWILTRLRQHAPRVIGISALFSAYADDTLALVRRIADELPQCYLVLGGHHPTACPEASLAASGADFVIRGEGELSFTQLVRVLLARPRPSAPSEPDLQAELEAVAGLCYRRADGGLRLGDPAQVSDLSALPLPASGLIDQRFYRHREGERQGSRAVIVTSRGCRLSCSYCSVGATSALSFRQSGLPAVEAELHQAVVVDGARFIDFEDENVSWDRRRFHGLLALLAPYQRRYGIECRAMNGLLPSTLDAETVAAMHEAGFRALNLSLGSSSRERLRRFRRPDERPHFDHALACAEAQGMQAVGYVLAAAPGQSAGESLDDLFYLAERRVLIGLSIFYPAPGSRDFAELERRALLGPQVSWRGAALPLEDVTTRQEAVTLLRLARLLNFIKAEFDGGRGLPAAEPLEQRQLPPADRQAVGRRLLAAFLDDGRLRGIDPDGEVYLHRVDAALCGAFTRRVVKAQIRGVRR